MAAAACVGGGDADPDFANAFSSPEQLADAVLEALADSNRNALEGLLVTREEHLNLLWSQLPESRDMEFPAARELNTRNTNKALEHMLADFGGERFELLRLDLFDEPEVYEGFTVHFVRRFVARRVQDGQEGTLPFLDVLVERNDRWKPMNYDE